MKIKKKNYANPLNPREFMEVWSEKIWNPMLLWRQRGSQILRCDKSAVREISRFKTS